MRALTKSTLIIFLLWTMVCGLWTVSYADIPHLINYQGKLTDKDNKPVTDGTYPVTFRIYDSETAGSLLWEETQSITVQKGVFSVLLGGVTNLSLPFDKPYFLEIKVKDEVLSPRQRIASVGYAYRAENANQAQNSDKVDGCDAGASANNVLKLTDTGKIPTSALKVYDSGWFAVTANQAYTKTHNLGTTKVIFTVYYSSDSDGSVHSEPVDYQIDIAANPTWRIGGRVCDVTNTTCVVRTGLQYVAVTMFDDGNVVPSGYYRVIGIALE